jgi:hypothetical protein
LLAVTTTRSIAPLMKSSSTFFTRPEPLSLPRAILLVASSAQ